MTIAPSTRQPAMSPVSPPVRAGRPTTFLLFLFSFVFLHSGQTSAQVRHLALPEMTSSAGSIFVGTVTDAQGGTDQLQNIVTYTTFSVEQSIHGGGGSTQSIKQLGGQANGLVDRLVHMRYFTKGERVLVMLYPVSAIGYTSPIGMNQGVWSVVGDMVVGVDPTIFEGVNPLLLIKHNIVLNPASTVSLVSFTGLLSELGGIQKKNPAGIQSRLKGRGK